jgi:hypothetical protein
MKFILNLMIKPVDAKHFMTPDELAEEQALTEKASHKAADAESAARGSFGMTGVLAWLAVGIPFLIGVWIAIGKATALFMH